ncbi:DUF397 domain-containing protein [Streptomyces sp. NPDC047081]|uniref:DUF397 domain-containing protein n=1 Tax=Streptomyces sp. NPDC047081 TaxID=3154706 RepID=UPI0033F7EA9A
MENQATQWRKSSYSGDQGGECLEVAEAPTAVSVRDSKNVTGPVLSFRPDAFRQFVTSFAARCDLHSLRKK